MLSKLIRYLPIIIALFRFLSRLFGRKAQAGTRMPPLGGDSNRLDTDGWESIPGAQSPAETSKGLDPIDDHAHNDHRRDTSSRKEAVARAYRNRQSDVVLTDQGTVSRILDDDLEGSRHQRLIVRVNRDLSILIAHNIDLAPRVPVRKGDFIRFKGEYEWDERGGYLHWTHHDPKGWHEEGWIEHNNKRYG